MRVTRSAIHSGFSIVVCVVVTLVGAAGISRGAVAAEDAPVIAPSECDRNPFPPALVALLADRYPHNRFTAHVLDLEDGCRYALNPGRQQSTASVIKITIMAATILRAQDQGRGLTGWEVSQIQPMIARSDDPTASALWVSLGGADGVQRYLDRFGLAETVPVEPKWGASLTSASDQVDLMHAMLLGPGPLTAENRALARTFLLSVIPEQQWGATAGVPDGWPVPMKNGFFDSAGWDWRINTVGLAEGPHDTGWVVAILSDGWPSDEPGVAAVEIVNRSIAYHLLRIRPAEHPFIDVFEGAFFEPHLDGLWRNGVIEGRDPIHFDPARAVTRGQFASLLYRLAGSPPLPTGGVPPAFTDVPAESAHHDAVSWMATEGITHGTAPDRFGPTEIVTRAQAAAFLHRFSGQPAASPGAAFHDVDSSADYADAVAWMAERGITTGTTPTTFDPGAPVTRGQAVAFLGRLLALP